jgi:hypothetical protein
MISSSVFMIFIATLPNKTLLKQGKICLDITIFTSIPQTTLQVQS